VHCQWDRKARVRGVRCCVPGIRCPRNTPEYVRCCVPGIRGVPGIRVPGIRPEYARGIRNSRHVPEKCGFHARLEFASFRAKILQAETMSTNSGSTSPWVLVTAAALLSIPAGVAVIWLTDGAEAERKVRNADEGLPRPQVSESAPSSERKEGIPGGSLSREASDFAKIAPLAVQKVRLAREAAAAGVEAASKGRTGTAGYYSTYRTMTLPMPWPNTYEGKAIVADWGAS
jgi:hypothetical protein